MSSSIKSWIQASCLCTFLLLAAFVAQGKEKIETPHKRVEGKSIIPTLHVPWVYRNHPMLSKSSLPLSLDPIRFTLHANKQIITIGEEVEITISAQLLDIPASAFFIIEDQKAFSLKLLLPQGFTQTGGDYQEYIGGKLTTPHSSFTKRIRGIFTSLPENPCFVLLRGAYNANSSSIFEQKQVLCLSKKTTPKATREADCVSPWIAIQNKTCGTNTYNLNVSVSQEALLASNVGQISGTAPNYTITNIPQTSELILTATNCDKQVQLILPVSPCQSCAPPTLTVGVPNCGTTTYSFGVDMFDGVSLTTNFGNLTGSAPHFTINNISLGQNITLTATAANGCQSQVIVSGSACSSNNNSGQSCTSPVLTPISPQTICYGGAFYTVTTSVTNNVEVNYQWYNDNGPANNNTNLIVGEERANLRTFPTTPGIYKYKVVATSPVSSSCSSSQTVMLTINPSPSLTSATGNNPSCVPNFGGAISVAGTGGTSFLYSKDDGGNWVDLTGSNAQNEINRNAMLYAPQNDVARVKITLEEGFGLGPGGEYTGQILNQSSPPTFEGLAAGTYNIRVKDENGCISAPTAVTLTNPNAPAIFNVTGGGACLPNGAPINLSGSVVGVNYYLLRNGIAVTGAVAGTGGALYFANHSNEGTYTVVASSASSGCSAQMNNSVVVSSGTPPTAPTNSEGDKMYCAGKPNLLGVSVGAGQTADWYSTPTGGTPLSGGTGVVSFAPLTTGVYYVETRDIATKCKSTTRTPVTLYAAPTLSITGSSSIGCENPTALLTAETSSNLPSSIPVSYAWKMGSNSTIVATTPTFSAAQEGTYTIALSYQGCSLTASQAVSNTAPIATLSNNYQLECSGSLNISPTISNETLDNQYEWSGPNGLISTAKNVTVNQEGNYFLAIKRGTTTCNTQSVWVAARAEKPIQPTLSATRTFLDPLNATTILTAQGCSGAVQWSYTINDLTNVSNNLNQTVLNETVAETVSIDLEVNSSPTLTLTYPTIPFQSAATYTASCVGTCEKSLPSVAVKVARYSCIGHIQASEDRIMEGKKVLLSMTTCVSATGQQGTVVWQENGITIGAFTSREFTPGTTTTYTAKCILYDEYGQNIGCTDTKQIIVDKKCTGVIASASPASIKAGDPVLLRANGCAGNIEWFDKYPSLNSLGSSSTTIVYPQYNNDYYLSCTDASSTKCLITTNSVNVSCNFKLAVNNNNVTSLSWLTVINKTNAEISTIGCIGSIGWTKEGENEIISNNKITFEGFKTGFKLKARCLSTGCIAETYINSAPKDGPCDEGGNFQPIKLVNQDYKSITLEINNYPYFIWSDDSSLPKMRTIDKPTTTSVFTVKSVDGCTRSFIYEPQATNLSIPCSAFAVNAPKVVEIGSSQTSKTFTISTSGCNSPQPGTVSWSWINSSGQTIKSGTGTTATITVNDIDKNKTFTFTASCKIEGRATDETMSVTIAIKKQQVAPALPQDPCNFFVYTKFYNNVILVGTPIEFSVFTDPQSTVTIFPQNISPTPTQISSNDGTRNYSIPTSFEPKTYSYLIQNRTKDNLICQTLLYVFVSRNLTSETYDVYTPTPTEALSTSSRCGDIGYYSFGTSYATFGIPHNSPSGAVSQANKGGSSSALGVFAIYTTQEGNGYGTYRNPEYIGLVDKSCIAKRGELQFYTNSSRQTQLSGKATTPLLHVPVKLPTQKTPYYGRCIYNDNTYCDITIVIDPQMLPNGRLDFTDSESENNAAPCYYSTKEGSNILLNNVLCKQLSVNKGNERLVLEMLKELLASEGIALSAITDAMVADLVAGKCNAVIDALTQNLTGNSPVSTLQQLVSTQKANTIVNKILELISTKDAQFCRSGIAPVENVTEAVSNGRLAAYDIDYERFFIAPDGRALKLPVGAIPKFFTFGGLHLNPPKGSLQGFMTKDGDIYFAEIVSSSGVFKGYQKVNTNTNGTRVESCEYYPENLYIATTDPKPIYYFEYFATDGRCGYRWAEANYTFNPTPWQVTNLPSISGPAKNITYLENCEGDVWENIEGNKFRLRTQNGNITKVQGTWQTFGKCPTCPSIAEQALQAALAKVPGTLTKETVIIEAKKGANAVFYGTTDTASPNFLGSIEYSEMKLLDLLKNLSKTYNSLVDKAKVPEAVWKPQIDLPAEDKNFFVRDNTGVIVGSLDGVAGEATDKAQLVGLGLKLVSDPEGAWNSLVSFKNSLDWSKAGIIAKTMAQGIVGYDATEFEKGGIYSKHATGKVAGTITFDIVTGSIVLSMVNKVPDLLELLRRVIQKLEDANWSKADIDAFTWDFQKSEDLLNKFDDGTLDPNAWRLMKDTQSKKVHLPTLTKVTELLRDADFMAKLQGGETTLTDILKNAANPLDAGTASKLVTLTEHLENLRIVVKNHHDVEGFDKILTDLKINTFEKQDGIAHSLNHMKELPAGSVQKVDYVFEPEVEGGLPCTNCRFDVQMVKPTIPPSDWVKYYEYKSYLEAKNIGLDQFKNYLATIDNLSELRYIFNAKKLTTDQAKIGMKAFLKANADKIIKPVSEGGIGEVKFNQLFATDDVDVFKARLENANYFNQYTSFVDSK